jgi:hypothetical protein
LPHDAMLYFFKFEARRPVVMCCSNRGLKRAHPIPIGADKDNSIAVVKI